jgi:prevent-host-death family protein
MSGGNVGEAVSVLEAKTHLSRLLVEVETGVSAEIVIARNGKPVARLVPMPAEKPKPKRFFGMAKGRLVLPDDWYERDKEMDAEIERMFYGE